jgi:hypothetical protein
VASFLFFVILPLKGTTGKFTLQWKNENKQKIFYRGIKAQLAIEALKIGAGIAEFSSRYVVYFTVGCNARKPCKHYSLSLIFGKFAI